MNWAKFFAIFICFMASCLCLFAYFSFADDTAAFQNKVDQLNQEIDQLQAKLDQEAAQLKTLNQRADDLAPRMQAECEKDEASIACEKITEEAHSVVEQAEVLQHQTNQDEAQLQLKLTNYQELIQEGSQMLKVLNQLEKNAVKTT